MDREASKGPSCEGGLTVHNVTMPQPLWQRASHAIAAADKIRGARPCFLHSIVALPARGTNRRHHMIHHLPACRPLACGIGGELASSGCGQLAWRLEATQHMEETRRAGLHARLKLCTYLLHTSKTSKNPTFLPGNSDGRTPYRQSLGPLSLSRPARIQCRLSARAGAVRRRTCLCLPVLIPTPCSLGNPWPVAERPHFPSASAGAAAS